MKNYLEIYDKPVFHGGWKVELQREKHNVPSLSSNNRLSRSILTHEETRFLVVREQNLLFSPLIFTLDTCGYTEWWNSENWCRFNWIILGDLSQIWFHMALCILPSLPSQDSSLFQKKGSKEKVHLLQISEPCLRWDDVSSLSEISCFQVIQAFASLSLNFLDVGICFHETGLQ